MLPVRKPFLWQSSPTVWVAVSKFMDDVVKWCQRGWDGMKRPTAVLTEQLLNTLSLESREQRAQNRGHLRTLTSNNLSKHLYLWCGWRRKATRKNVCTQTHIYITCVCNVHVPYTHTLFRTIPLSADVISTSSFDWHFLQLSTNVKSTSNQQQISPSLDYG